MFMNTRAVFKFLGRNFYLLQFPLIVYIIFILVGYSFGPLGHYNPAPNSLFRIEFDYPPEWGLLLEHDEGFRKSHILAWETYQGEPCINTIDIKWDGRGNLGYSTVHCRGRNNIEFTVEKISPNSQWADLYYSNTLEKISTNHGITLIGLDETIIDGHAARMITYHSDTRASIDDYVIREIIVQVGKRGYVFTSYMNPANYDSEFLQIFLSVVNSIQFI